MTERRASRPADLDAFAVGAAWALENVAAGEDDADPQVTTTRAIRVVGTRGYVEGYRAARGLPPLPVEQGVARRIGTGLGWALVILGAALALMAGGALLGLAAARAWS